MTKIKNLKAIHNLNAKPIILYLTDFSVATDVIYVNVICLAYLQSGNDVLYLPCNS